MPATLELPHFCEIVTVAGAPWTFRPNGGLAEPGHPASHTSRVGLWIGTLLALFLLITPGTIVARITQLTWPVAIAVGPALTYGVVALAIIPFGALEIPWNGWTALATLAVVCVRHTGLQLLSARYRDTEAESRGIGRWPAVLVAAGVLLGAALIMWAGLSRPHALAVHSEHLGRGLARQRGALHSRHGPGVVHTHGRAPQRRDPPGAVLPFGVPRADRGVLPAQRRGPHHRLHPDFGGRVGLAVSVRRGHPDLVPVAAATVPNGAPRPCRPPPRRCRRRSPRCPMSSSASPRCPTWPPTGSRSRLSC